MRHRKGERTERTEEFLNEMERGLPQHWGKVGFDAYLMGFIMAVDCAMRHPEWVQGIPEVVGFPDASAAADELVENFPL